MDVLVSCPACRFSVSVPEEDVLTAEILCRRCRHVFGPLGPDVPLPPPPVPPPEPSYPKIPAYVAPVTIRGKPRRRSDRPPASERSAAVPVRRGRPRRVWPWVTGAAVVLFGLLAIGGTAQWAIKRANGEGTWTRHSPPNAPEIDLEFPITPAAADERVALLRVGTGETMGHESFRVFKCELSNGETYAVWTRTVPLDVLRGTIDAQYRRDAVLKLPSHVRGGDWRQFQRRVVATGGYESNECFVPQGNGNRSYVVRTVLIEDRLYTLFVTGPTVTPDAPRVVRFFDSFRHGRVPPEDIWTEPQDTPDPDALRLVARIEPNSGAAFAPNLNAVFVSNGRGTPAAPTRNPVKGTPVSPRVVVPAGSRDGYHALHVTRYHFPSFRTETVMPVGGQFTVVAVDEVGGRVRGWGAGPRTGASGWARERAGDVAYRLPAPGALDWKEPRAWETPVEPDQYNPAAVSLPALHRLLDPDRRGLYSMAGTSGTFFTAEWAYKPELLRAVEYPALTLRAELTVPNSRNALTVAPDAARVFVLTGTVAPPTAPEFGADYVGQRSVVVLKEIDADTLRVRRDVPLRADVTHIAAIGGNRLIGFGCARPPSTSMRPHSRSVLIDLNTDPPHERLVPLPLTVQWDELRHLLHGNRLYTLGANKLHVFDVSGAAAGRVRLIGETKVQGTEMFISPDGKYLVMNDGCVYWLGGAGPLPPVDPEARWPE
ncbi:unnamed protein product [Gemmata massiliana]|uniref:Uncharacterized protein n=1 Tax=Gemmata massiliana TaxID=1210884 RepID=A0A6P2D3L8_9BACT|nr:hypothetical protein [Gemmata massiliana]VTR93990.1 unnamed protein product [Gemmata massiliana]